MDNSRIIPNLFIVGAPKCGTTALDHYLAHHPEIFMPPEKMLGVETNHFATDLIPSDDPYRSDEKYFAMFEKAGDKKVVGESSVYYLLSKEAAKNIHRFNPSAKIIIMLRNPIDMLQSFHAQLIYNGDEDILDFEAALAAEPGRKSGRIKVKDSLRFKERLFYSDVVSYTEQVRRYFSLFGKEQVYTIIYDDFKKDTARIYKDVLKFLNVDQTFQTDYRLINTRKMVNAYRFPHLFGMYDRIKQQPMLLAMARLLMPQSARQYLSSVFTKHYMAYEQTPPMRPVARKQLQEQYRSEVNNLSALLGVDLQHWYEDKRTL